MTDHEFTETEQAAIEKAAERLEHVLVSSDAIDAAYDIAQEIRSAIFIAAYNEAEEALGHLAGFHMGSLSADWIDGVNTARKIVGEQRDAIRAELDEGVES